MKKKNEAKKLNKNIVTWMIDWIEPIHKTKQA